MFAVVAGLGLWSITKITSQATPIATIKSDMIEQVINKEKTEYTPVWFMRQAGRYMKDYLKVKEKYSFLQMCLTPELSSEIAYMPVKKFNFDAAIFFSDILIPFLFMGIELNYSPQPIVDIKLDIKTLKSIKIAQVNDFNFAAKSLTALKDKLAGKDIIGFVGAPFTMAYYLLGQDLNMFYKLEEDILDELMQKITASATNFAMAQLESKINIVQIFDTKAALLTPKEYRKYALPYNTKLIENLKLKKAKIIYFFLGGLDIAAEAAALDIDCFSTDYSNKISSFHKLLKTTMQGNLNPEVLLCQKEEIKKEISDIIEDAKNLDGHIFNLGHGILKNTPEYNVSLAVDFIHNYSKR